VTYMRTVIAKRATQILSWVSMLHTIEAVSRSTSSTNTPVATWSAPMFPEWNISKIWNSSNVSLSWSIQSGTLSYTVIV
jgi:hypothetical protein